ncbi:hypothetical protein ACIOWM_08210 [Streptomyces anulatus]
MLATLVCLPVSSYLPGRFGFHAFSGLKLETDGYRITGHADRHFDDYDKRDFSLAQV